MSDKRGRKVEISQLLDKWINLIRQKDSYGFFLSPVDLKTAPDYRTVVKEPMDLGTMKQKVKEKKYTSVDQFKHDFELVTKNAKMYNGPDTVYYKQAEKLRVQGLKIIERDKNVNVVPDSVAVAAEDVFEDDDQDESSSMSGNSIGASTSAAASVPRNTKAIPVREFTEKRSYKTKQFEELEFKMYEFYHMDGTKLHELKRPVTFSNPVEMFSRYYDVHIVDVLESYPGLVNMTGGDPFYPDPYVSWNYTFMNPVTTEERKKRGLTISEMEKRVNVYGGEKGYRYVDSLRSFLADAFEITTENVDEMQVKIKKDDMEVDSKTELAQKTIEKYEQDIKKWTRGAEVLVNETRAYLKRTKVEGSAVKEETETETSNQQSHSVSVELGTVDIAAVIKECEQELEKLFREAEVELIIANIKRPEQASVGTPNSQSGSSQPAQVPPIWIPLNMLADSVGLLNNAQPLHITDQNVGEALELVRNELKIVNELKEDPNKANMDMMISMGMNMRGVGGEKAERLRKIQNALAGIVLYSRRVVIRNTGGGYVSGVSASANNARPTPMPNQNMQARVAVPPQQMRRPPPMRPPQQMWQGPPQGMGGQMPPGMPGGQMMMNMQSLTPQQRQMLMMQQLQRRPPQMQQHPQAQQGFANRMMPQMGQQRLPPGMNMQMPGHMNPNMLQSQMNQMKYQMQPSPQPMQSQMASPMQGQPNHMVGQMQQSMSQNPYNILPPVSNSMMPNYSNQAGQQPNNNGQPGNGNMNMGRMSPMVQMSQMNPSPLGMLSPSMNNGMTSPTMGAGISPSMGNGMQSPNLGNGMPFPGMGHPGMQQQPQNPQMSPNMVGMNMYMYYQRPPPN